MRATNRSASPLRAADLPLCAGNICALRVDQVYVRSPLEICVFGGSVHLSEKTHYCREDGQMRGHQDDRTGQTRQDPLHHIASG
jgi:hypothetical protein